MAQIQVDSQLVAEKLADQLRMVMVDLAITRAVMQQQQAKLDEYEALADERDAEQKDATPRRSAE